MTSPNLETRISAAQDEYLMAERIVEHMIEDGASQARIDEKLAEATAIAYKLDELLALDAARHAGQPVDPYTASLEHCPEAFHEMQCQDMAGYS